MTFLFGDCRLDLHTRTLESGDQLRHLSPKALELLRLLLEARPRVVSKAELMNRLWPETFVSDANLPVLIGEVRLAIGDDARESRLIKTHHTVGYSFIGMVRELRAAHVGAALPPMFLATGNSRIPVHEGVNTVGRDIESHVRLMDLSVSKYHAHIIASADGAAVLDLESKNGTRVNGVRVAGLTRLSDSATLHFGSVEAAFIVVRDVTVSTQTVVSAPPGE